MTALKGKVALVTGASRGIGRATAVRLARDGAHVIAHYGKSQAEAKDLANNVAASGGKITLVQGDLAKDADVSRIADAVRAAVKAIGGALHILVNNAGVAPFVPFAETTGQTLDEVLAVNVKAPFLLTAKLHDLIPTGGRVIFLTTAMTKTYFPGISAYSASKGAVDTLILHLAAELGAKGIRVTGVAPGAIETDMSAWLNSDEGKNQAHAIQALKRIGKPDDIANVVAFLAGPDADWVTGHIVNASGGTKL